MFEARIAELNRFNEQNPVSYDKRTYTVDEIQDILGSRVPIKQYLQKFPQWGRFGVTSVTPFLLLPVHPEGYTPAHHT